MGDIEKALNRKEIIRRDCKTCHGNGWVGQQGTSESLCEACGGTGMEEKEIPFAFDKTKPLTKADEAEIWGDPAPVQKPLSASGE